MKLKCVIASNSALAAVITRSPEQARKRFAAITGKTAHIVHVEMPEDGLSSADHLERCVSVFGTVQRLTTGHLGTVWLTHITDESTAATDLMGSPNRTILQGRVREVAHREAVAMREEARRTIEVRRLRRRLAELGANDDHPVVDAA